MVKIVLNADDFGRSITRNQAIDDSFKQALICSAGLIVTGKNLQNALNYIKKGNYFEKIHLHLNLSTSYKEEDPEDTPITLAMKKDPLFCENGKFSPGLPYRFVDIRKWKVVYCELIAQYQRFKEITEGKANYKHIDFHLWSNLTWPSSVALYFFIRKYKIESVRFIGIHQMNSIGYRILSRISKGLKCIKHIPATNIDYYLSKEKMLNKYKTIELYCHPNYKQGIFLDDSPSYLQHEMQPMIKQIEMLKSLDNMEFISWKDL